MKKNYTKKYNADPSTPKGIVVSEERTESYVFDSEADAIVNEGIYQAKGWRVKSRTSSEHVYFRSFSKLVEHKA